MSSLRLGVDLVFWASLAAILYAYLGYPIVLICASALRPRPVKRSAFEPSVSVIIAAYNEERHLGAKLENTLALEYPPALLEIIVASDCSTDRTDEIALGLADRGVSLHRQTERLAKTAAQNAAIERARGEIVLFSDATTLCRPDVLRAMLPSFADPSVGCVAGRLVYVDPSDSGIGRGARSYWSYETFLKRYESSVCSLIGASGCLYAVRRSAYVPLDHDACGDFIIATKMVEQGMRAIYEETAVCIEETNRRAGKELQMRVRIVAQTVMDLWRHRSMLSPFTSGFYAVELLSHKVLRYLVPFFSIGVFVASAAGAAFSTFFRVALAVQVVFYATASLAWLLERRGVKHGLLAMPEYFLISNLSSLIGFYKFLRGERYARWDPIRETGHPGASAPPGAPQTRELG